MADQQQPEQVSSGGGAHATTSAPTATSKPSHPAASMAETMLARGERAPRPYASLIASHPDAQHAILALLHATAGNAFVGEVIAAQRTNVDAPATAADVTLGPVRIMASALRVRSSPSTANTQNIVGRLVRGTIITTTAKDGDWLRIDHEGQQCFIHGDYVASVVAPPKVVAEPKGEEAEEVQGAVAAPTVVAAPPTAPVAPIAPANANAGIANAGVAPIAPENVGRVGALPGIVPAGPVMGFDTTPTMAGPAMPLAAPTMPMAGPTLAGPITPTPPITAPTNTPPITAPITAPTNTPTNTQPTHTATPDTKTATPDSKTATPDAKADAKTADATAALTGNYKGVFSKVYSTGSQKSQVWVSEGGVSSTPNIYVHFHGHRTDHGIDPDLKWSEGELKENKETGEKYQPAPKSHRGNVKVRGSGYDAAKDAMDAATGQNTVVILPQGVLGEGGGGANEGGYMADLERLGLSAFLDKILKPLAKDLGVTALAPGNIALGGHSAGGYEGIHSAMRRLEGKDKDLADNITDVTLYDASYGSGTHLDETRTWAFHGKPNKTVRIVNGWAQQTTKTKNHAAHDLWAARFGRTALGKYAEKQGMTTRDLTKEPKEALDAETTIQERTQVINKDGSVQVDVLVLQYSAPGANDHEPLRDRMIDDAIMNIGDGPAGNATFGRHEKGRLKEKAASLRQQEKEVAADDGVFEQIAVETAHADTPVPSNLPQPEHVDGDDRATKAEPVKPPPVAEKLAPKIEKKKKVNAEDEALRKELYDDKTGRVRVSKLGRHSVADVKGKRVPIDLTDAQYEFKQKCYRLATSKIKPGQLYGGVDDDKLAPIPGTSHRIRKEVLPDLNAFIKAAGDAGHKISVGSGYRPPEEDMNIWSKAFDTMYLWETQKVRQAKWPDDEFGDEAAAYLVDQIKGRKAPPGSSNHSNGIAVDFDAHENGKHIPNQFKKQGPWRESAVFAWLLKHAKDHNFKNLSTEAWHFDWRP